MHSYKAIESVGGRWRQQRMTKVEGLGICHMRAWVGLGWGLGGPGDLEFRISKPELFMSATCTVNFTVQYLDIRTMVGDWHLSVRRLYCSGTSDGGIMPSRGGGPYFFGIAKQAFFAF